jgi:hypothetical protein
MDADSFLIMPPAVRKKRNRFLDAGFCVFSPPRNAPDLFQVTELFAKREVWNGRK